MLSLIKKIFSSNTVDLSELLNNGAVVVDVRSKEEFASGHVKGSINIPLNQIGSQAGKLKKYNHVIVCCRSGNRSGMAKSALNANGLQNVTNGGSWQNVRNHIKQ